MSGHTRASPSSGAAGRPLAPAPARPRRVACTIPAGSPQWVLLRVLREVLERPWALAPAAARLSSEVPDSRLLRRARARLRGLAGQGTTDVQARAIVMLSLAIDRIEDGDPAPTQPVAPGRPEG